MKKILSAAAALAVCMSAQAQNVNDALRFSQNDYYGTARSISMGNAFTALGGDLGSATVNPAGTAVNKYSQITISPSINILSGKTAFSADGRVDNWNSAAKTGYSKSDMEVPNFGVTMSFDTHRKRGIKSFTIGAVLNSTAYYNDDLTARGYNGKTSYLGHLANLASAEKMTEYELNKISYWDMSPYYWPAMIGYRTWMISESGYGDYAGATQGITKDGYPVRDELLQTYNRISSGNKYDMVLNFALNLNDKLYLGANIGITQLEYRLNSRICEEAVNEYGFPIIMGNRSDYFSSMMMNEFYSASGSGGYAKIGFIALPVKGLRIGAAIQTPTANYITEHLWYSGKTSFMQNSFSDAVPEEDEYIYDYKFISPMRANVGLAYTFGRFGLVSADYEICDYSGMKFIDTNSSDNSGFEDSNKSIREGAGVSHMLRIGAELNVLPCLAIRAGYNLTTTPERYKDKNGNLRSPGTHAQVLAFGVGYKSPNSFFFDLALRGKFNPDEYIYPYPTYGEYESPEIMNRSALANVVATFGWRF